MKANNDSNLITFQNTNSDCANYTGTVTVATYFGNTLVDKEIHHNAGLANLFKFIGNCLQGSWRDAQNTRPCKLVLLRADANEKFLIDVANEETVITDEDIQDDPETEPDSGLEEGENPTGEENVIYSTPLTKPEYWKSDYAVCNPIMYDTPPIADLSSITDSIPSSSVTYHFRVPFLSLINNSDIKKLMLLPSNASDYSREACAYFVLKKPLNIPSPNSNFTVIIDWKLTFTNATGENNE